MIVMFLLNLKYETISSPLHMVTTLLQTDLRMFLTFGNSETNYAGHI